MTAQEVKPVDVPAEFVKQLNARVLDLIGGVLAKHTRGVLAGVFDEIDKRDGQIKALRNLLTDIQPLLAECDCIHSDQENPVQCPCKRLRAELEKP